METSGPDDRSQPLHLPDYAEMRRSMLEWAKGQGLDGLPCPTPGCDGPLRVADGEVTCETCGGPADPHSAGLVR